MGQKENCKVNFNMLYLFNVEYRISCWCLPNNNLIFVACNSTNNFAHMSMGWFEFRQPRLGSAG